jgi:hypothetical protein
MRVSDELKMIIEEFAECYEGDCPFYEAETASYYERCGRCEIDTGE